MKNLFDLTDKVAIITGGGGALGGGLAEALANYGCDVVLTGRTVSTLAETVKKVEKIGRKALACLLYTSPSPRDATLSRMPSSA